MKNKSKWLVACSVALAMAGCSGGGNDTPEKFTIAVIGDVPYGTTPTDTTQSLLHPAFINAINSDADAQFLVHVGDIHSGKQYCTEAYDNSIANDYKTLKKPLVYTPGDNEWADCHKVAQGGGSYSATTGTINYILDANGNKVDYQGGDPVANLELVRKIFFAQAGKDFTGKMDVHSQAIEFDPAFPADKAYVENVWFEKNGVVFATFNLPGGSNNDMDIWYGAPTMSASQSAEVATRTAAVKRWLDVAFKQATGATAMVIVLQADMWNLDGAPASHIVQYKQFIDIIAQRAKDLGKPVLLLNGDSHIYRSDNPLVPGAACLIEPSSGAVAAACTDDVSVNQPGGYNVPNFHRITVHGSTLPLEWMKLTIDPGYDRSLPATSTTFGPFSWQRIKS